MTIQTLLNEWDDLRMLVFNQPLQNYENMKKEWFLQIVYNHFWCYESYDTSFKFQISKQTKQNLEGGDNKTNECCIFWVHHYIIISNYFNTLIVTLIGRLAPSPEPGFPRKPAFVTHDNEASFCVIITLITNGWDMPTNLWFFLLFTINTTYYA